MKFSNGLLDYISYQIFTSLGINYLNVIPFPEQGTYKFWSKTFYRKQICMKNNKCATIITESVFILFPQLFF